MSDLINIVRFNSTGTPQRPANLSNNVATAKRDGAQIQTGNCTSCGGMDVTWLIPRSIVGDNHARDKNKKYDER